MALPALALSQSNNSLFFPPSVGAETNTGLSIADKDSCWVQHSRTFYEWRCADRHLPESAKELGLSIGVIQGRRSVLVIDSGATTNVGFQAATAVQARFPGRKIYVLNTQAKPAHFLGNFGFLQAISGDLKKASAFQSRFVAAQAVTDEIIKNCPACIQPVLEATGNKDIKPNEIVAPGFSLSRDKGTIGLIDAEWVNWRYELLPNVTALHAMFIENKQENVRWVGTAVQKMNVPDLMGASSINRLNFLASLRAELRPGLVLLGSYGLVTKPWLEANIDYLTKLQMSVFRGVDAGLSESELLRVLSQTIRIKKPNLTATELERHRSNISQVFYEFEKFAL